MVDDAKTGRGTRFRMGSATRLALRAIAESYVLRRMRCLEGGAVTPIGQNGLLRKRSINRVQDPPIQSCVVKLDDMVDA